MSARAFTPADTARLEQSFAVGLSRSPVPAMDGLATAANPVLAALAWLGLQKRFRAAGPVPITLAAALPPDDRPVLPQDARVALRQLVTGSKAPSWDVLAEATADRAEERGYRFHPFDLHWLEKYLKDVGRHHRFGPTEQAWLAHVQNRAASEAPDDIDDENWERFPKAERLDYLERRRGTDPAAGRELLESVFADEPANLRAHLLAGLKVGLGPSDRAFLEQACSDRAKMVRDKAGALLGRIPGTERYAERLAAGLDAIQVKSAGLISRRRRLSYRPKGRKAGDPMAAHDAGELLDGIALADIADRFEIPRHDLLAAAADDRPLTSALLRMAASEGLWDLILAAAAAGHVDWSEIVMAVDEPLARQPIDRRRSFVVGLVGAGRLADLRQSIALGRLYGCLREPLGDPEARRLLAGPGWRDLVAALPDAREHSEEVQALRAIAVLMPPSQSDRFLSDIEPLPREIKLRPTLYHQFAAALNIETSS